MGVWSFVTRLSQDFDAVIILEWDRAWKPLDVMELLQMLHDTQLWISMSTSQSKYLVTRNDYQRYDTEM